MIRPALNIPDPEDLTIRAVVEWYKDQQTMMQKVMSDSDSYPLTGEEVNYVNGRFAHLARRLAEAQGVPVGWLSYSIQQLVQHEMALAESATLEGVASGAL